MQENDEQFSGDKLDEPGDEESKATPEEEQAPGDELDEPEGEKSESVPEEGESSGDELDESGDELDEPEDEKSESVPEEGEFSGGELDESGDELDEPEDEESEAIPEEEDSKGIEGKFRQKKRLLLCIAIGLCLFIGIGHFYLKWKKSNIPLNQKKDTRQVNRLAIPEAQLLIFPSFVIPSKENRGFTYISLSISFNVPNKELKREMIEKKGQLRGIIYDMLREEIHKEKEIPSLKKLKECIIRAVNMILSAGNVSEVYISKFLGV